MEQTLMPAKVATKRLVPTARRNKNIQQLPKKLKAISLFSGAGGMDVGFSRANYEILWANDIDSDSCKTYAANHGDVVRCGDLRGYMDELGRFKGVDVVFGGPPCQGFSVAGKMDPNDERSKLVFSFMDVIDKVKPRAFVMENVKALGALDKWSEVRKKLIKKAYDLDYKYAQIVILNATEFNVPQKRERMFFVGIRDPKKAQGLNILSYLERQKKSPRKVGEIIRQLGEAGNPKNGRVCRAKITLASNPILRRSPYAGMLFNGAGRPIDPNGYSNTLPASMGGNKTPIIDENLVFGGKKDWLKGYHSSLMRGVPAEFKDAPVFLRRLTVDEALRIQTFPDSYNFQGKQNSIYRQIGNAVPCELAHAVAVSLREMLD